MKKVRVVRILIIFIILAFAFIPNVKAASLTISTSQDSANTGDKVTITVNGNGMTGKVSLTASDGGSISPSSVNVNNSKETATLTITGSNDVKVTATTEDASDSETGDSYTHSTGATIKVSKNNTNTSSEDNKQEAPTTTTSNESKKSSNANLGDFGVTPNDFKGFRYGTTQYNTTVPNDVEEVTVYAKVQDPKAKITSGTGKQKLKVGKNALSVVVTAEDGTTKTYTVNVTREEAASTPNEETPKSDEKEETTKKDGDLTKLEVEGYTLNPKFSPDIYEYKLEINDNKDSLNVITEGASSDVSIEVAGNTNLKDGENTITVLVYNEQTKQNSTYQISVNKVVKETVNHDEENQRKNEAIKKANIVRTILLGIFAFIILAIVIFIIIRHKIKSKENVVEERDFDPELDERIDLKDEEELFKRVNKEKFNEKVKEDNIVENYRNSRDKENEANKEEYNEKDSEEDIENNKEPKQEFFRSSKPKGKHF